MSNTLERRIQMDILDKGGKNRQDDSTRQGGVMQVSGPTSKLITWDTEHLC